MKTSTRSKVVSAMAVLLVATVALYAGVNSYDGIDIVLSDMPSGSLPLVTYLNFTGGDESYQHHTEGLYQYSDPNLGTFLGATVEGQFVPSGDTALVPIGSGSDTIVVTAGLGGWTGNQGNVPVITHKAK